MEGGVGRRVEREVTRRAALVGGVATAHEAVGARGTARDLTEVARDVEDLAVRGRIPLEARPISPAILEEGQHGARIPGGQHAILIAGGHRVEVVGLQVAVLRRGRSDGALGSRRITPVAMTCCRN